MKNYKAPTTVASAEYAKKHVEKARAFFLEIYRELSDGDGGYTKKLPPYGLLDFSEQIVHSIKGEQKEDAVFTPGLIHVAHKYFLQNDFKTGDNILEVAEAVVSTVVGYSEDKNRSGRKLTGLDLPGLSRKLFNLRTRNATSFIYNSYRAPYDVKPVDPHVFFLELSTANKISQKQTITPSLPVNRPTRPPRAKRRVEPYQYDLFRPKPGN